MKKFLLLALLLALATGPSLAQAALSAASATPPASGDYVLVRMIEVGSALYPSEIIVAYGNGKTETIELDRFAKSKWASNSDKMHTVLARLLAEGYEMVSSTGGNSDKVFMSTYFLRRRQ